MCIHNSSDCIFTQTGNFEHIFTCDMCCAQCHIKMIEKYVNKTTKQKELLYKVLVSKFELKHVPLNTILCIMHLCYMRPKYLRVMLIYMLPEHFMHLDMTRFKDRKHRWAILDYIYRMVCEDRWNILPSAMIKNPTITLEDLYTFMLNIGCMYNTQLKYIHEWFINMKVNVFINTEIITKKIITNSYDHDIYEMYIDLGFEFTEQQLHLFNIYGKIDPNVELDPFVKVVKYIIDTGRYTNNNPLGYAIMRCVYDKDVKPEYLHLYKEYETRKDMKKIIETDHVITYDHILAYLDKPKYRSEDFIDFAEHMLEYEPDIGMNNVFRYVL